MTAFLKTVLIAATLAVTGVAAAAGAADPVVGTWTLNVAKSTFTPGPAPKSQTRTYTVDADGVSVTVTGVAADGSAISQQSTFKYDGKAYPWKGAPDWDALTLKRVNASTVKSTLLRAGKPVGTTTRTVSGHGKVLTLKNEVKDAAGTSHSTVSVFDKK